MGWVDPKTDWDSLQEGVEGDDFNRIEGNIDFLSKSGGIVDLDGNTYGTVTINNLQWITENWRCTKFADGTPIPEVTDQTAWNALTTPAYCKYDNKLLRYGRLYNYEAIDPLGADEIAPDGWRVATAADWELMLIYLGDTGYTYDLSTGGSSGEKMARALADTRGWSPDLGVNDPGNDQWFNNSSGLALGPGGYRTTSFGGITEDGRYWAPITGAPTPPTNHLLIQHNEPDVEVITAGFAKASGLPIRLVRSV